MNFRLFNCFLTGILCLNLINGEQFNYNEMLINSRIVHFPKDKIFLGMAGDFFPKEEDLKRFRNDSLASGSCKEDLSTVYASLSEDKLWAMQFLDSSSKLQSGIFQGNVQNLGSLDECLSLNDKLSLPYHPSSPFATHMCEVHVKPAKVPYLQLKMFICFPRSCDITTIDSFINTSLNRLFPYTPHMSANVRTCINSDSQKLDTAAIIVIVFVIMYCCIILSATLLDIFILYKEKSPVGTAVNDLNEESPLLEKNSRKSRYSAFSNCRDFSLRVNLKKLLSVEKKAGSLGVLNGMRVISMSWVILGHTYVFGFTLYQNTSDIGKLERNWMFQVIENGIYSVDTFFLISGTLTSYLLLKELYNKGGPRNINWIYVICYRYIRLTPPYMILLAINACLSKYWASGPLWPVGGFDPTCKNSWWTNILYINNLVKNHTACFPWAWYLACDFQFFLLSLVLISFYYIKPKIGHILVVILIFVSSMYVGLMTYFRGYGPTNVLDPLISPDLQRMADYFYYIYSYPVARWTPYIVGVALGYILLKSKRDTMIKYYVLASGWVPAIVMSLSVVYGLVDYPVHPLSDEVSALYASLCKLAWSLAISWVIFVCEMGYGSFVNSFLSSSIFTPLSRLTYMAYLGHPMIIFTFYMSSQNTYHLQPMVMIILFTGFLLTSYSMAVILSLFFEAPILALQRKIMKR